MKECKRCFELVILIRHAMMDDDLEKAKVLTNELLDILNGYDSAC